ncbi:hypothetical protein K439DRAFT_1628718 [Ramaria rubella]|nr:hypothetical protein K439DRAFT_1628718 [Ramaria rubella]
MSFRTYPPNPVLQRLRLRNNDDLNLVFTPPAQDNASSSTVAHDKYTISDYGCLATPHSFAEAPQVPKRLHLHRRSSATTQNRSTIAPTSQDIQHTEATEHKTLEVVRQTDGRQGVASHLQGEEPETSAGLMITRRPVFVLEKEGTDEHENAIILKGKWEKLSRATPRKLCIQHGVLQLPDA